ncbi:centrosomal protein of 104 kDa [Eurytemora carolleeae]|uniref:centrosomal protein of 104 kDa n=1 Tax=Eurytemora carolleeae TaxID=1294199 RepID=UPI000C78DA01|nr:centrosomal protein of 104 kDa [Eurytemora carolleeae]|eukprot:XP_023330151.1 centrosomal protein of 104 kDa-like [Eurytemora affinis]
MPVRLDFRVVESTSQDDGFSHSNILEIGPQSKGWLSSKYSIYPQSLVLLLSTPAQIEQIQMLGNAWAVSTQIDIQVGEVARGSSRDRKNAHFMELGSVFPESNEQFDYNARQLITVEIADDGRPCPVSFIKLVFHKNYQNKKNQYNQVGLTAISIIGTPAGSDNTEGEFNLDQVLSPYDELSFLVYTDTEITQLILKLEKRKLDAAGTERFEYAKKIKEAIDELCLA